MTRYIVALQWWVTGKKEVWKVSDLQHWCNYRNTTASAWNRVYYLAKGSTLSHFSSLQTSLTGLVCLFYCWTDLDLHSLWNVHMHVVYSDTSAQTQTWFLLWTNLSQLLQGAISHLTFRLKGVQYWLTFTEAWRNACSLPAEQRFSVCLPYALSVCHQGCCPTGTISRPLHHCLNSHCAGQMTCAGSGNVTYHDFYNSLWSKKSIYMLQCCTNISMI